MTVPAVIPAVTAALEADSTLAGLVPGRWWHDAAPAGTVRPFGIVELADDLTADPELGDVVGAWSGVVSLRVVVDGNARATARAARDRALLVIALLPVVGAWRVMSAWGAGVFEGLEVSDASRTWSNAGAFVELELEQ